MLLINIYVCVCICRTVFFGEYECMGVGANYTYRVSYAKQLKVNEATPFLDISYIDGDNWLIPNIPRTTPRNYNFDLPAGRLIQTY